MTSAMNRREAPDYEIAIIGTGFSGLGMAIRLKERGERRFVLIERAASVGGTWRDNHYPGAACDVPSHLYSFSFEPNPDWSRKYPTQPELKAYLEGIAKKHDLIPHIQLGTELLSADYDVTTQLWRITTSRGTLTARALVSASGGLSEPKLPDIPGMDRFRGKIFHSARWDHAYDLTGKRVAVIGTGASAIQFVPEIAGKIARLDVYQRTPPWIIPRDDRAYSRIEKWLFRRVPLARRLHRAQIYWLHELRVLGLVTDPALMKLFQKIAERHIARQVNTNTAKNTKDPALLAKVTPNYTIGCKRVLISNDWYPALQKPGVSLITEGISEIREGSVVTAGGEARDADCIILGTGFYATESPIAGRIRGPGGRSLAEAWERGEEAYLGTVVKGFPNLFLIVGPNTGLGHSSMVFMIEAQVGYILRLLDHLRGAGAASLEVKAEAHDGYNRRLQERLGGSVWATGCKSWYQHRSGKITALWPGFTFEFWLRAQRLRRGDYRLSNG
jgi:cation diffusion facilitator CzcD-associated flavoprotein CzcO